MTNNTLTSANTMSIELIEKAIADMEKPYTPPTLQFEGQFDGYEYWYNSATFTRAKIKIRPRYWYELRQYLESKGIGIDDFAWGKWEAI